jgi:hypothetical protein
MAAEPSLRRACVWLLVTLCAVPAAATAQSLSSGSLRGVVLDQAGLGVSAAEIALEDSRGATIRVIEADFRGRFSVPLLAPGTYRVLVEQVGFQPVRYLNVVIAAGQATSITATLERRPPPILEVHEIEATTTMASVAAGRVLPGSDLAGQGRGLDLAGLSHQLTELGGVHDGRDGLMLSGAGLPARWSRLYVDGVQEPLLRHPGLPAEPASAPAFARAGLGQLQVLNRASDHEWRGTPGSIVAAQTRRGSGAFGFSPYVTFSGASLGGAAADNPADSSASSLQAGAAISGAMIPDTLSVYLRLDYQRLQQPASLPWTRDAQPVGGEEEQPGSLRSELTTIAADRHGQNISRFVEPPLRTWQGVSGMGRLDWRLGSSSQLVLRAAGASWEERAPVVGTDLMSGAGVELEGQDLSAMVGITTTGTNRANELRVGVSSARRTWIAPQAVAATTLAAEGAGFGIGPAFPASFSVTSIDISDAFQIAWHAHQIKLGAGLVARSHRQTYAWGAGGLWHFGGVSQFGDREGDWMQVTGTAQAEFTSTEIGVFAQDVWQIAPELQVQIGARYEQHGLPSDKLGVHLPWLGATGVSSNVTPTGGGLAPRLGFVWDGRGRGGLVVRGSVGLHYAGVDPAVFAEAITFNGTGRVRRGQGSFSAWPAAPSTTEAPWSGTRLTIFSPDYQPPRALKADFGVSAALSAGTTLTLSAGYHHTDYLLRREDLNLAPSSGRTAGDRPVYGRLVRQGALVSPAPGSNRRFGTFDQVFGLVSNGYASYYELSATLERRLARGLTVVAGYTFSKTEDNTPGLVSGNPADQVNPFPEGIGGVDWTVGRSDFDVPHRLMLSGEYVTGGRTPLTLGARYRLRSGLPFTPGLAPGVDINGDGSSANDPVFLGAVGGGLAGCSGGVGGFAARNSCRGDMVQGLDLRLSVGLPVGAAYGLALTVDAFNVVATETGVIDRAAALVDPNGPFSVDALTGAVSVPLVANPNFGSLLSRRGEPRLVRVGLRLEY